MAIPKEFTDSIDRFLSVLSRVAGHTNISNDGNKYELYVYSLAYKGLSKRFTLIPKDINAASRFHFRCSPGRINATNNIDPFSYFEFSNGNRTYQLRNGIEVKGFLSEFEIDICVFSTWDAGFGNFPQHSSLKLALECKFYKDADDLKGEVRKYIGAMSDICNHPKVKQYYSPGDIHTGFSYFRSFVSSVNKDSRPDLRKFVNAYELFPRFGVKPNCDEETKLIDDIYIWCYNW